MEDQFKAYIVYCEDFDFGEETGSEVISEWSLKQDPPKEALAFMKIAEEKGAVLTLRGLELELNRGNRVGTDDYVFITSIPQEQFLIQDESTHMFFKFSWASVFWTSEREKAARLTEREANGLIKLNPKNWFTDKKVTLVKDDQK